MFVQHRTIGFRLGLTILVTLILLLIGCGGPTPTPTPTPEEPIAIATPVVTILRKPPDPEVPIGRQVILAAEATGCNLKIQWRPERGEVSNPEGPSTIYTAPDEPGSDTVDVTVTSNGWSTTERVIFTVVAQPTETLAPTNTPSSTPTLAETPTRTPTNTPVISTRSPTATQTLATSSTPTVTPTPIKTPTTTPTQFSTTDTPIMPSMLQGPLGTLSVKTLEGCDSSFAVKEDNEIIGTFAAGAETPIAAGTYDIVLYNDFRQEPITKSVVIREGEETLVDFTQELGALLTSRYPRIAKPLHYDVFQGGDSLIEFRSVGKRYCVLPGIYTIEFTLMAWEMSFEVEIPAGEVTVVRPETWPKQLGLMAFSETVRSLQIMDQQTGDPVGHAAGYAWVDRTYWMVAETYKIVVKDPYFGLTYENVEIKPGEETVLQLTDQSSP